MSLRDKHRLKMQQQSQRQPDMPSMKLPDVDGENAELMQQLNSSRSNTSSTNTTKLSRKELYEKKMREAPSAAYQARAPTPASASSSSSSSSSSDNTPPMATLGPRPATAFNVNAPSEADLKRKAYLEEAKARNASSHKQFEDRVKNYFSKAVEIEARKALSPSVKVGNKKEQQQEALEQGLFLGELKAIGLDVGKMSSVAAKMKPASDGDGSSRGRRSYDQGGNNNNRSSNGDYARPSTTMTSTPSTYTPSPTYGGGGGGGGYASGGGVGGSSADLSGVEARLSTLESSVAAQGNKLDMILDLQRQMLQLLISEKVSSGSGGGGGGGGGGGFSGECYPGPSPADPMADLRNNRRRR